MGEGQSLTPVREYVWRPCSPTNTALSVSSSPFHLFSLSLFLVFLSLFLSPSLSFLSLSPCLSGSVSSNLFSFSSPYFPLNLYPLISLSPFFLFYPFSLCLCASARVFLSGSLLPSSLCLSVSVSPPLSPFAGAAQQDN